MYVVARDFGFAPNPFHGYCTLATCKPRIRNNARVNDWIIGMGGSRLKSTGQCIFAMHVTEIITFDEYWVSSRFLDKKPIISGSRKMMVGDNIYHRDVVNKKWCQADSHHSNEDGSTNLDNLKRDTNSDKVLLSQHFFYFGRGAKSVPCELLNAIGYKNVRDYRVFDSNTTASNKLIGWLRDSFQEFLNQVTDDPFDFSKSEKRYSVSNNKVF
jgi:Nucleotide modification associated domain 2